jgi:hypothetical protein
MAEYLLELIVDPSEPGERYCFREQAGDLFLDDVVWGEGLVDLNIPLKTIDMLSGTTTASDVSFEIAREMFDPVLAKQAGIPLQRMRANVYWWRGETDLSKVTKVYSGVVGPFTIKDATASASVRAPKHTLNKEFPAGRLGDEGRFSLYVKSTRDTSISAAKPCQVVYGTCYDVPLYLIDFDYIPGIPPRYRVRFYLASHPIKDISTLKVSNDSASYTGGFVTFGQAVDGLGQTYTYVDVDSLSSSVNSYLEKEWCVATVEGMTDGGQLVEGLGDVLKHLALTYAQGVEALDLGRIENARRQLNRYKVGCLFNSEGTDVLGMLEQRFAQEFPVAFSYENGLYGWDYVGLPDPLPVLRLRYGHNAVDRSDVSETDVFEVVNQYMVSYKNSSVSAGGSQSLLVNENNSSVCRASVERWGKSVVQSLELPDVVEQATARLVVDDRARLQGKVRTRVSYSVFDSEADKVNLLSVVQVVDPEFLWDDELFIVESVQPTSDGLVKLGLLSYEGY